MGLSHISKKSKYALYLSILIMSAFFLVKTAVFFDFFPSTCTTRGIEYACFLAFIPTFGVFVREYLSKNKEDARQGEYVKKLNGVLIEQSHNHLLYEGDVSNGAKDLLKEVARCLGVDRASVWLYSESKDSISCEQLYVSKEDAFYQNIELFEKDYSAYFRHLAEDPIIVAADAETHPATSCFLESYLRPLGIKSMLDVPVIYKGEVIGVICIESTEVKKWDKVEVDFARMLSSLYSFAYSVRKSNHVSKELIEMERFIEAAALVSKADHMGKITHVNQKFSDVSGWSMADAIGKDHHIVNSGVHPRGFWKEMYDTVINDRNIWNRIVTNKAKNGSLYYVDTHIKANFDSDTGELLGFTSIRQDVTRLKKTETEIRNRMNAINKSNAVIEFDLEGKIMYANSIFCDLMGYSESELVGRCHKVFLAEEYLFANSKSKEYKKFWKMLKEGEHISGEFERTTKSGKKIWLQASYNPIIDESGKVYKIMKIATDITKRIEQSEEIEQKNTYLEHAAKILRHDMHSGINTYIPRGINSLERRLTEEDIKRLKIEGPLKMIKEGLRHTQKVYKGVYEFTNLVKKDVVLSKKQCDIKAILSDYLSSTSYKSQVMLDDNLPTIEVNESLFCTSIDNLIRNGLKYNDSDARLVKVFSEGEFICVADNGRGLTQEEFTYLSKPYVRKENQKESGSGLGLNICIAILKEHGFSIAAEKLKEGGTKLKIKIR